MHCHSHQYKKDLLGLVFSSCAFCLIFVTNSLLFVCSFFRILNPFSLLKKKILFIRSWVLLLLQAQRYALLSFCGGHLFDFNKS